MVSAAGPTSVRSAGSDCCMAELVRCLEYFVPFPPLPSVPNPITQKGETRHNAIKTPNVVVAREGLMDLDIPVPRSGSARTITGSRG
jgi:hypothetical protein